MRRPVGAPVAEHRDHVPAHRVGVERLGEARLAGRQPPGAMVLSICGGTSIDMVARSRWSRSRSAKNASLSPGPVSCAQLAEVLHAVRTLPLGRLPLGRGHAGPAREAPPVRLGELGTPIHVGLAEHRPTTSAVRYNVR